MCLGIPGKVLAVNGAVANVDFFGIQRETRLDVLGESVVPGDFILRSAGFAIRKIPPDELDETLAVYELLLRGAGAEEMAEDVRSRIVP